MSSNEVAVTVTVTPVDDAPVATADTYSADEDTTLNINATLGVLANDNDVDGADFAKFANCFNKAGNPPRSLGCPQP